MCLHTAHACAHVRSASFWAALALQDLRLHKRLVYQTIKRCEPVASYSTVTCSNCMGVLTLQASTVLDYSRRHKPTETPHAMQLRPPVLLI